MDDKNMNKICTSIEQSKKLIELGIDINTADMYYQWYSETESALHVGKGSKKLNADCPSWSLTALLGLMPTDDKKDEYYVNTESHFDYYVVSYKNCWDGCIHSEYSTESLIDAAFEIVCWLKENGKI